MKYTPTVEQTFAGIKDLSIAAYKEVEAVLPSIAPYGEADTLYWLEACKALYSFERDAGRAFIRGSLEAEQVSEEVRTWTGQALAFMQWRASWRALEGFMANVARAYGSLGHAGEKRWAEIGFGWCARQIESGAAYFSMPVLDLSGRLGGITAIEQIAGPADELYESRKLMLGTYLTGAVRVRNLLGAQAILPWAARGADIMQTGRARGEAYFRLESEESLAMLLEHLPGFKVAERSRLLAMLLDVWYGETFELKESTWSPEQGRPFIETDGRSLFLPAVMGSRDEAILGVLHAAGHLRHGTFERRGLRDIYAAAGVPFPESGPVSWSALFMRFGEDALTFQLIFDICEDTRVDHRIVQTIPRYLHRLQAAALAMPRHPDNAPYHDLALAGIRAALAHDAADPVFGACCSPPRPPSRTPTAPRSRCTKNANCPSSPIWKPSAAPICPAAVRMRRASPIRRSRKASPIPNSRAARSAKAKPSRVRTKAKRRRAPRKANVRKVRSRKR